MFRPADKLVTIFGVLALIYIVPDGTLASGAPT